MGYTDEELSIIYDKNRGYCWHCGKKLAFTNYGQYGKKGAWEVDHSKLGESSIILLSGLLNFL
jgi:hypothetical protein